MSNHKAGDSTWRADYKVSSVKQDRAAQQCFGEIKPFACKDDSKKAKDIIKTLKYSKKAVVKFNYNFFISFVAQDDMVRFFTIRHLSSTMSIAAQIEGFKLPSTASELSQVGLILTKLLRLSKLYSTCQANSIDAREDVDLPESIIDFF